MTADRVEYAKQRMRESDSIEELLAWAWWGALYGAPTVPMPKLDCSDMPFHPPPEPK